MEEDWAIFMARQILDMPASKRNRIHICGYIQDDPVFYNPGWSFHIKSDKEIRFLYEGAMRVDENCNYSLSELKNDTDQVKHLISFNSGFWTPWSSVLESLGLTFKGDSEIEPNSLPDTLTYLEFYNDRYKTLELGKGSIGHSVVKLVINYHDLKEGIIPDSVRNLSIYDWVGPLELKPLIPSTTSSLTITGTYIFDNGPIPDLPFQSGDIPDTVKELTFQNIIHRKANNEPCVVWPKGIIPKGVKSLIFGNNFNFKLESGAIPDTVEKVTFQGDKIDSFGGELFQSLPSSVRELNLPNQRSSTNIFEEPPLFGSSIKILKFSYRNIKLGSLPSTLEQLYFDGDIKSLELGSLPIYLTHLKLSHFTWNPNEIDLKSIIAPLTKLTHLYLGGRFNVPLSKGTLPDSLLHLELGSYFNQPLSDPNSLPPYLESLAISTIFNQPTEAIIPALPPTLVRLEILPSGLNRDHKLPDNLYQLLTELLDSKFIRIQYLFGIRIQSLGIEDPYIYFSNSCVPKQHTPEKFERYISGSEFKIEETGEWVKLTRSSVPKLLALKSIQINDQFLQDKATKVKPNDRIKIVFSNIDAFKSTSMKNNQFNNNSKEQQLQSQPKQTTTSNNNNTLVGNSNIKLNLLFEDGYLAVINKPAGLLVHPTPVSKTTVINSENQTGTLVNALIHRYGIKGLSDAGGLDRPGIVHRLDKDTSGILVIAKDNDTHLKLKDLLKSHTTSMISHNNNVLKPTKSQPSSTTAAAESQTELTIQKKYYCIVLGKLKEKSGFITARIKRHPQDKNKMVISDDGKESITEYKVLKEWEKIDLKVYKKNNNNSNSDKDKDNNEYDDFISNLSSNKKNKKKNQPLKKQSINKGFAQPIKQKQQQNQLKTKKIGVNDFSLIEIILHTGRTHQIRVHMSHIGHPIIGDPIYSSKSKKFQVPYLLLASMELSFVHPITLMKQHFKIEYPQHFNDFIKSIEKEQVNNNKINNIKNNHNNSDDVGIDSEEDEILKSTIDRKSMNGSKASNNFPKVNRKTTSTTSKSRQKK
eukprot:gene3214-4026_t